MQKNLKNKKYCWVLQQFTCWIFLWNVIPFIYYLIDLGYLRGFFIAILKLGCTYMKHMSFWNIFPKFVIKFWFFMSNKIMKYTTCIITIPNAKIANFVIVLPTVWLWLSIYYSKSAWGLALHTPVLNKKIHLTTTTKPLPLAGKCINLF